MKEIVLTLSCADRPGIVAAVSGFLADHEFSIRESQQYGDQETGLFFMRVHAVADRSADLSELRSRFRRVSEPLGMKAAFHDPGHRLRLLVMVSKQGHCLNDLLHRVRTDSLRAEIVAVVSNHDDLRELVEWHSIPFHHVPVTPDTKPWAEDELRKLVTAYSAETVVLARYMQILSDPLCRELDGRAINIHHSLLPSFKGARPYFQAHARGVKVVGATAHYVTGDLDEGPIIEQDFVRVDHSHSATDLTETGRDLEAMALARAVTAHAEHRVMINGGKTVVFRR
ncbi:formyltetrahydrofolate deformylase [Streptomyces caniscabiei]|uniref:formyltetrahydrofolate deformylase n=1 Tax=Streptomyces TaxID=1883 RepID=UPI0029B5F1BC|nr:formyltetrahydrofolate deformylase [Streptomyces caniscabiei]MDX2604465.1 formyltetrahydrofolate deformylase [Streptomyces caniscabiei]MDX2735807.1 formyltetrahydrofolate deformylase [Streptomyces caniscabiei]MDX2782968.1 formyltetrahydrofolate deformylase [Streptomyces caniscabiei]